MPVYNTQLVNTLPETRVLACQCICEGHRARTAQNERKFTHVFESSLVTVVAVWIEGGGKETDLLPPTCSFEISLACSEGCFEA